MFTGLIDHFGSIVECERRTDAMCLQIETQFTDLSLGESIAVDGVCLTVTDMAASSFSCELSPETLHLTHFQECAPACHVNLERALCLQDRLGGHFVMGHVDQTVTVSHIQNQGDFWQVDFSGVVPAALMYLTPKGSVTVNGVSLTINAVNEAGFSVMLIPHTLSRTNLSELKNNQTVNVEYDHLAKCVAHQLAHCKKEVTL